MNACCCGSSRATERACCLNHQEFLIRGNMVDMVVAVVVGASFTALVNAMVTDIITPTIAAIFGQPDFSHIQ